MRIFVGVLSARINIVGPLAKLIEWAQDAGKHTVHVAVDETFGVDAGRSSLIERAKKWGCDIAFFFDSDVIPEESLQAFLSIIKQAFSRGYDMVVSPTLSIDKQILLFDKDNKPFGSPRAIPTSELFEVGRAGLGFFALSRKAIDSLKPLSEAIFINGPKKPLYCIYTVTLGEDYSLCDNVRACGNKIGCEPRLRVQHLKLQGIPSWRDGLLPR